jgi:hypothetical protein
MVNLATGNFLFQYHGEDNVFAKAVESANDAALQLGSPVAVMSHFSDAADKYLFKSELYVAQP